MSLDYDKGVYSVECIECALGKNSKGNPMITLKVQVQDYVLPDGSLQPEQKQYERRIYMSVDPNDDASIEETAIRLRCAGWQGSRFESLPNDMVGLRFHADCWHSTNKGSDPKYAGQMEEKWAIHNPDRKGNFESKPLEHDPSVARSMNALFGKVLKSGQASQGSAKPPVRQPAQSRPAPTPADQSRGFEGRGDDEPPDDDVPF